MSHHCPVQTNNTTHAFLNFRFAAIILAVLVITQSGCSIWRAFDDTAALTYRDFVWARRAFNLRYGSCDRPYAEHFRSGFCEGYADVCGGGDGFAPALPPQSYRGYEFQSADGSKCVDAWFEGYPAGVAAAKKDNSGTYNDISVSRMIQAAIQQEEKKPTVDGKAPNVVKSGGSGTRTPLKSANITPPRLSVPQPLVTPSAIPVNRPPTPTSKPESKFPPIVQPTAFNQPDVPGEPIAFGQTTIPHEE